MKLLNRFDGRECDVFGLMSSEERTLWLLRKRLKDFDRCVNTEHLYVSFLTITQSDKSVAEGYRWVTDVMHSLVAKVRRSGSKIYYVAVLEIQPKRYKERGTLAPHWHIAVATSSPGTLPHAEHGDDRRIKKVRDGSIITWEWLFSNVKQKFGMYFCCDAYSVNVYDYLGKYLAKGTELSAFRRSLGNKKVRVFSSSRIPVACQMTEGQKDEFEKLVSDVPDFSDLYWRREGCRIVARAKETEEIYYESGASFLKIRYPKIHSISGDWIIVGESEVGPWIEVMQESSSNQEKD